MVSGAHLVVTVSLLAVGLALCATRSYAAESPKKEPTILAVVEPGVHGAAHAEIEGAIRRADPQQQAEPDAVGTLDGKGDHQQSADREDRGGGLFTNNSKIHIQDSQIILTPRDRQNLIKTIAKAMVMDQVKAIAKGVNASTPLVPLTRDAFLYLKDDGVVRLGWRYPLATWQVYKDFMVPEACEVQREIGAFFYC